MELQTDVVGASMHPIVHQPEPLPSLPKPYYEERGITIYHGDCREILPLLGRVDLVFADPPYNVDLQYKGYRDGMQINQYRAFCRDWWVKSMAIAKSVVVTPGAEHLAFWATFEPSWVYCWRNPTNSGGGRACMKLSWEPVVAFGFPLKPLATDVMDYNVKHGGESQFDHPCQKPLGMLKRIIERWVPEDGIVVDPFLGSGTTARAAKDTGRRAIGIEQSEEYCEVAARRLSQGVLF